MLATTVSVEVLIAVEYADTILTPEELATNLRLNVESATGRGLLTDGVDGMVETQKVTARGLTVQEGDLDESQVADWLTEQIVDGHLKLEDITSQMARFAFASPAVMRQEFAERMGL